MNSDVEVLVPNNSHRSRHTVFVLLHSMDTLQTGLNLSDPSTFIISLKNSIQICFTPFLPPLSIQMLVSFWEQCCRFSRNIAQVTPKIIYFYYQRIFLHDESIQKIN